MVVFPPGVTFSDYQCGGATHPCGRSRNDDVLTTSSRKVGFRDVSETLPRGISPDFRNGHEEHLSREIVKAFRTISPESSAQGAFASRGVNYDAVVGRTFSALVLC